MIARVARNTVALVGLTILSTGCFELESVVVINANGSATSSQKIVITEGFANIIREMSALDTSKDPMAELRENLGELDKAKKKSLKAQGLKVTTYVMDFDADTPTMHIAAKAKTLASLDYLTELTSEGKSTERRARLTEGVGGLVTLAVKDSPPSTPTGADDDAEEESEDTDVQMSAEDTQRMQELAMSAMGERSLMEMTYSITVPGEIDSVDPESGARVDGDTVVWTITPTAMMMGGFDPTQGFQVSFRPAKPLPAKAFE